MRELLDELMAMREDLNCVLNGPVHDVEDAGDAKDVLEVQEHVIGVVLVTWVRGGQPHNQGSNDSCNGWWHGKHKQRW